ncbi:MAG: hypothetical protein Q9226_002288 [Calogaya cf. arnoldii]
MSGASGPPKSDMAALIDNKHYRARRHSLMHPPSIYLPDRRTTVPSPLDPEDTIWKPLVRPAPITSSPSPQSPAAPGNTTTTHSPTSNISSAAPADLTPSDIHAFCNRDTILYMPHPYLSGPSTQALCKAIHRTWYPRRSSDARDPTGACKPGCGFGKAVVLTGHEGTHATEDNNQVRELQSTERTLRGDAKTALETEKLLSELVGLHECLVVALERVVEGGGEGGMFLPKGINPRESPAAAAGGGQWYSLYRTLRDCFIVVEGNSWESDGVLIVWRGNELPAQLGTGTALGVGNKV